MTKGFVECRRVEDEFIKAHPTTPELKQKLERAHEQMLSRRDRAIQGEIRGDLP